MCANLAGALRLLSSGALQEIQGNSPGASLLRIPRYCLAWSRTPTLAVPYRQLTPNSTGETLPC